MAKRLDPKKIGTEYMVTYNSIRFTGTITNDPAKFKFYQMVGLDVFIYEVKSDSTKESNNKPKRKPNTSGKNNDK